MRWHIRDGGQQVLDCEVRDNDRRLLDRDEAVFCCGLHVVYQGRKNRAVQVYKGKKSREARKDRQASTSRSNSDAGEKVVE